MGIIIKNSLLKKIITFGMICIIGMLIINDSVFMHTHKPSDGTIIIHSHPYDKSNDSKPYKTHHHTKAEFLFINHIEILFPILFLAISFSVYTQKSNFSSHIISDNDSVCIIIHKGRAPPYVL
jgi:hypothetical protein